MSVQPVIMPKLGAYVEDVLLLQWLVGEGEQVAPGKAILELETEKTTAEVESESSGWVHRLVSVGETVPIGATVALIADTHEEYEALVVAPGRAAARVSASSPISPRARALLEQLGFTLNDASAITGTGPGGRILDRDVDAWARARSSSSGPASPTEPTVSAAVPLRGSSGAGRGDVVVIDAKTQLALYRTMLTIRLFEQRVAREFRTGEIPGFVHMYIGEEAVAAGVCANLDDGDYVTSTHRGHGHCIAKGCDLGRMMAEIYGREDGLCKGRGGSMHIADFSRGMLGANAIVGGGIALATGAGLASSVRGSNQVAVAFFGDGAANQGILHESLNLAAIWTLPVVYVCENNGFAESTPTAYATSVPDVAGRAAAYGIPGVIADGADVLEVYTAARAALSRARAGDGPTLLEVKTYRFMGHFEGDPDRYRDDGERRATRERDAIAALQAHLTEAGHANESELEAIRAELEGAVSRAVDFARASPFPDAAELERYVYPEQLAQAL